MTISTWSSISWLCQIFSNKIPLKLMSQYFEVFWSFFSAFEISIKSKIRWKTIHWTNFWQYRWTKQFLKNPGRSFITTFLLFETNSSPSFFCLWSSSYRTSQRVFWIKYGMNFSKLLFGMINNKGTPLFSLLFFPHLSLTVNNRNWK